MPKVYAPIDHGEACSIVVVDVDPVVKLMITVGDVQHQYSLSGDMFRSLRQQINALDRKLPAERGGSANAHRAVNSAAS